MSSYSDSINLIRQDARKRRIPYSGTFELTSRCNFKCDFCYLCDRSNNQHKRVEKSTDEWLSMIGQAADAGMFECCFTGGEPFLREDFEEIYCKSYDKGLRISIYTNASLLNERHFAYLYKRKPDLISVSLYGATEDGYAEVCGVKNAYEKVMHNLHALKASELPFEVKVLGLNPLVRELDGMKQLVESLDCRSRYDFMLDYGREDRYRQIERWRIPLNKLNAARKALVEYQHTDSCKKDTDAVSDVEKHSGGMPCGAGNFAFTITYDGKMQGCLMLTCYQTFPFLTGFDAAWQELRELARQAKACEDCKLCPDSDYCAACPAQRLSETGATEHCSQYLRSYAHVLSEL